MVSDQAPLTAPLKTHDESVPAYGVDVIAGCGWDVGGVDDLGECPRSYSPQGKGSAFVRMAAYEACEDQGKEEEETQSFPDLSLIHI